MLRSAAVFCLTTALLAASATLAADTPCDTTEYESSVIVGGQPVKGSTCDNPGHYCYPAPCGGDGMCKQADYQSGVKHCNCVQTTYGGTQYLNTKTSVVMDADAFDYPAAGSVTTYTFDPGGPYDETFIIMGDGYDAAHQTAPCGYTGYMVIEYWTEAPPFVYGVITSFELIMPSYDLYGEPTGTNYYVQLVSSDTPVTYDAGRNMLTSDTSMELWVENDQFGEPGWMTVEMQGIKVDEGYWYAHLSVANEYPAAGVPEAEPSTWGTVKSIYR
jgi:hypothetical protein